MPEKFTVPMTCVHTDPTDPDPDRRAKCSFLLSPVCPVNLLGSDLMCVFGIGVIPTPTGLRVVRFDKNHLFPDMFLLKSKSTHSFTFLWDINLCRAIDLLTEAQQLVSPLAVMRTPQQMHCISLVSPTPDEEYVDKFLDQSKDELELSYVYWHTHTCAVTVALTDKQKKFFRISNSVAHILLSLSPTDQETDPGHFVMTCEKLTDWTDTADDCISYSPSTGNYRKLLSWRVPCIRSIYILIETAPTTDTFLQGKNDILPTDVSPLLAKVPTHLWATHKYDVGLIKNCQPVVIIPRSDYRPQKHQYPLKQEAIDGIRPVFNSLLDTGVIIPCPDSPVRTPIFPVKKIRPKGIPTE